MQSVAQQRVRFFVGVDDSAHLLSMRIVLPKDGFGSKVFGQILMVFVVPLNLGDKERLEAVFTHLPDKIT